MDPDSPWDDNPCVHSVPEAEWTKMSSDFTNSGYGEGIIAGKEAFLQQGFDAGFADVGIPLGRELGNLRGAVAAMESFLSSQHPDSKEIEELRGISAILSSVRFSDIAPPDLEAERHAKDHLGFDDPAVLADAHSGLETAPQERRTQDIAKLKERLVLIGGKLGLRVFP